MDNNYCRQCKFKMSDRDTGWLVCMKNVKSVDYVTGEIQYRKCRESRKSDCCESFEPNLWSRISEKVKQVLGHGKKTET